MTPPPLAPLLGAARGQSPPRGRSQGHPETAVEVPRVGIGSGATRGHQGDVGM